jgi:hypothetical protein
MDRAKTRGRVSVTVRVLYARLQFGFGKDRVRLRFNIRDLR